MVIKIFSYAARASWGITKIVVFFGLLWGAIKSLGKAAPPIIADMINWINAAIPSFYGDSIIKWIAANWMTFAILLIVRNSEVNRWALNKKDKTSQ